MPTSQPAAGPPQSRTAYLLLRTNLRFERRCRVTFGHAPSWSHGGSLSTGYDSRACLPCPPRIAPVRPLSSSTYLTDLGIPRRMVCAWVRANCILARTALREITSHVVCNLATV